MSNRLKGIERRQHRRVDWQLPLNVVVNGYDFATTTQNVSCLGAYCRIDKYMPPFTKVMVKLSFKNYNVECKGVVVRSEDENTGGFNIAIFFNEINDSQRHRISQHINQFLPQKPS